MWRDLLIAWLFFQVFVLLRAWRKWRKRMRARRALMNRLHTKVSIPREAMFYYDEVTKQ